ncbi:hypothetical protein C8R44DRAFT_858171 [Mycena epipterygia]|nr:hypothetical protein C8R44DRAFT_858171 [Mycena epipterygia]
MEVGPSLWPRVWPWILCLHARWDQLLGFDLVDPSFYTDFLLFAGDFHDHAKTYAIMSSTTGFRVMVAKTWTCLSSLGNPDLLESVLDDLCGFIVDCDAKNPDNLAEIVEGAGGTLDDLADLVVKYLHAVVGRRRASDSTVYHIRGLLSFLADAAALVTAIKALAATSAPDTGFALDECFMLLRRILFTPLGSMWLEEAMDSELLPAIVMCATLGWARKINHHLRYFLERGIPVGLVYYYLVGQIKSSRAEVKELASSHAFQQCFVFEAWQHLMTLVEERLLLLAKLESLELVPSKACDNLECGEIDEKVYFQRCSRCKAFYYCTQECQIVDWQDGGHRGVCRSYSESSLRLTELVRPKVQVREREFLRALLHHDYEQHAVSICAKQINFMTQNPACDLLLTLFDYCTGPVQIEIHAATGSPLSAILEKSGAEWRDILSRTARSEGKLHLHIIKVLDGVTMRHWVIPLRTNGPEIQEGLRGLARKVSTHQTEVDTIAEIEAILHDDPDMLQIH